MTRISPAPPVPPRPRLVGAPVFGVTVDRASRLLAVVGEFDTAAVGHFVGAASILLGAGAGDVTVDLAGVRFVDAAGLGALVTVRNALAAVGSDLTLRGAGPATRRVFTVAGLVELLPEIEAA